MTDRGQPPRAVSMANQAHCAFCFETLSAHFEHRQPLRLAQVEALWEQYQSSNPLEAKHEAEDTDDERADGGEDEDDDAEMTDPEEAAPARPAAISRLLNHASSSTSSSNSSNSSLPSTRSSTNSQRLDGTSGAATPASSNSSMSSRSSLFSFGRKRSQKYEEHPLFVTWNTVSGRSGLKSLRGCIGTFEPQELEYGLRSYALTSALEDIRFAPIPATLLPSLSTHVTLLTDFSAPTRDPLDWSLGTHGLRISFTHHGRRYGSTYLPDVAKEQGWTKEETLVSLMRKAGWSGRAGEWEKVWREGRGELVRYEGRQVGLGYAEWRGWKDWVEGRGVGKEQLN